MRMIDVARRYKFFRGAEKWAGLWRLTAALQVEAGASRYDSYFKVEKP